MRIRGRVKWIIAAAAVGLLLFLVLFGGYMLTAGSRKEFPMNGYMLEVQDTEEGVAAVARNFGTGTKASKKFPDSWQYRDTNGEKFAASQKSFLHFEDGSLSSFSKGILTDVGELGKGVAEFYHIEELMVMAKGTEGWTIDNNNTQLPFAELVWELDEDLLLAASDDMELTLASGERSDISGYLEITYLDTGIVQLANQDQAWRTLAGGTQIKFASGAVFALDTGLFYDREGAACFSLTDMSIDMDLAVSLQSDTPASWEGWKAPVFQIYNDDGQDGTDGTAGEDGETGKEGEEGEEGEKGKNGETGAAGGRASGVIPGNESNLSTDPMGRVLITDITGADSDVSFTIKVNDPEGTLLGDSGVIRVREADSGIVVWSLDVDLTSIDTRTFRINDGSIKTDVPYLISVEGGYQINMESGITNTGNMVFVTRSFFVSSSGLSLDSVDLTKGSMTVKIAGYEQSPVTRAKIRVKVDGTDEDTYFESNEFDPKKLNAYTVEFLEEVVQQNFGCESAEDLADKTFTVSLYQAVGTEAFSLSPYQLTGVFLKADPQFGALEVHRMDGYCELQAPLVSDVNRAFQSVTFVVTDENGITMKTLTTSGTKAVWDYDAGLSGEFTVTAYVKWNDNVTALEKKLDAVKVQLPEDSRIQAELKLEQDDKAGKNHIKGQLEMTFQDPTGVSVLVKEQVVTMTLSASNGSWSSVTYVKLDTCRQADGSWKIPVSFYDERLLADGSETYTITLSGMVEETTEYAGGETETETRVEILFRESGLTAFPASQTGG